jgi:hypothetical protein
VALEESADELREMAELDEIVKLDNDIELDKAIELSGCEELRLSAEEETGVSWMVCKHPVSGNSRLKTKV